MKRILFALLLLIPGAVLGAKPWSLNAAQIAESGLTEQQAEQVLRLALQQSKYRKHFVSPHSYIEDGFVNQDGTPKTAGFYMFRLAYDGPKATMTWYFGPFLVSQKTGDVWDVSLSSGCVNFHSAALTRIQATIMKKTKTAIEDEKALRNNFDCLAD